MLVSYLAQKLVFYDCLVNLKINVMNDLGKVVHFVYCSLVEDLVLLCTLYGCTSMYVASKRSIFVRVSGVVRMWSSL